VQDKDKIDWNESIGIAVREYQTDVGPVDYVLFVERRPVGIIEAKKEDDGYRITSHESQAESYAKSKLKYRVVYYFMSDNLNSKNQPNPEARLEDTLS